MRLTGVDGVVLGVEDMSAAARFYTNFGLTASSDSARAKVFATNDDTSIELRSCDDNGLPAPVTGGSTIREILWAVSSQEELDAIAAELTRDRAVTCDEEGTLHSVDDDGYGVAFRIGRRRKIEPAPNLLNIYGAEPNRPVNSRVDFLQAVRPAAIAHVVLKSPDVERAMRFYVERLGFRVTDKFAGGHGAFLRSGGSPYHHNLFLIRSEDRGLHHVAFAVTDFNQVVLGGQSMLDSGWESSWGPGRHVIGSNFFWYFKSPCGGAMELTADMDRADDDWVTGEWDFVPQNTMAWSVEFRNLPGQGKGSPH